MIDVNLQKSLKKKKAVSFSLRMFIVIVPSVLMFILSREILQKVF